jgi:hypothetical protein
VEKKVAETLANEQGTRFIDLPARADARGGILIGLSQPALGGPDTLATLPNVSTIGLLLPAVQKVR